jgi:putative methionine-R-sulfoxide reductase with GAF domain
MSFPTGAPEVAAFLADLDAAGPVSQIPTGLCAKSVSSGTTMVVTVGAETSGDLECLAAAASPAAHALATDCDVLTGRL